MKDPIVAMARPADLPHIQKLIQALSAYHGDTAQVSLEWLQRMFFDEEDRATAFVARDGTRLVGYAGVTHKIVLHSGRERFDIQHLYIIEAWRGRGVGKALIEAARQFAQARGATGLTIGTDPANTAAQAAYLAMGMEDITTGNPRFWLPVAQSA